MKRFIKLCCLLLCVLLLSSCSFITNGSQRGPDLKPAEGTLQVCVFDVGQADCIYITLPNGENALIDAGNNADGELIVSHLRKNGVKSLTYLFGTHPHEDHIGGLDDVVKAFDIQNIYLPRVADKYVPTTKTYENLLDAIAQKEYRVHAAQAGTKIIDTDNLRLQILSPNGSAYRDMNLYSIVLRLDFGEHSFLFTGDAEAENEEEMLKAGYNVDVDVLKVGHHGSNTSSSKAFLQAASPQYAVISTGVGNTYGHPHDQTLQALQQAGVTVYRTDTEGTAIFTVQENTLSVQTTTEVMLDGNGER